MLHMSVRKPESFFSIFQHFSVYEQLKYHAQLGWAWKKLYYLGAWFAVPPWGVLLDKLRYFENYNKY